VCCAKGNRDHQSLQRYGSFLATFPQKSHGEVQPSAPDEQKNSRDARALVISAFAEELYSLKEEIRHISCKVDGNSKKKTKGKKSG
jgi:hypothetical protein